MNFVDSIGLNLDLLMQNVARLAQEAQSMPEPSEVRQIVGGGDETPESSYTQRLQTAATTLATHVKKVRDFVTNNADALSAAAETLQGTDALGGSSATQATSFIDDIVATGTPTTGGGSTTGGSAPTNTSSSGGGSTSTGTTSGL